jgi:hypothetical protein
MVQTSRYALPLLQSGQAQKEVTHNGAIAQIDALLHLAVESRTLAAPPAADAAATWIVAAGASGAWAGRDGQLAVLDDSDWSFIVPRDGCVAFVKAEGVFVYSAGGMWHDRWPVAALSIDGRATLAGAIAAVPPLAGVTVDAEARATLDQLIAALQSLGLLAAN